MKAKKIFVLIGTVGFCSLAYAQTTVNGRILDPKGQSVSGINVSVADKFTTSDQEGRFQIYVDKKGDFSLILSGVGYQKELVKVSPKGDQTALHPIVIKRVDQYIDEVEIMGYNSVNNKTIDIGKGGIMDKDLPQSVQIINAKVIADQQINGLGDALKNANGIALGSNRGGVNENFFARGYSLGSNNIFKNGARTNNGGSIEASTLESVEILKGSAALLYGGVSGGAVVNLVTKKPLFEFGGEVATRYGSWDRYKPTLDVYGPLSEKVAFRFIGTGESANSFRDYVSSERVYVNPSVLYKVSDKTDINFMVDYLSSNFTPDFGIGTVDGKITESVGRGTFLNVPWAFNKTNSTNSQVALDHRFNDNWKLNALVSLQSYLRNYYSSERINPKADGIAALALNRTMTDEFTTNQQINLTGAFQTGNIKHQLLFGGDADQSRTKAYAFNIYADQAHPTTPSTAYGSVNVFNPDTESFSFIPAVDKNTRTTTDISRYGAFIQDLVSVTAKFKVLAGIRYTYQITPTADKYTYATNQSESTGTSYDDKAWSPKFALIYQPLNTMSIYASYANNFTSNAASLDINNQPLGPSIIDHYEAGVKNDFFHGRVSANLTWYRINNNNFAQNVVLADGTIDSQHKEFTGETASDGVELDVTGEVVKGLNIMAGYAYNYMRYLSTLSTGNAENVRLVGTTAHTGNATAFYTVQSGALQRLKIGASVFYTGKRNAGWNNTKVNIADGVDRLISVDPFTTFDLSAGYSIGRVSLLAKVANITNEFNYYIHENYSVNPIPPRNFMTTLSYKF